MIIPCYNAHDTLGYALASVATQTEHSKIKVTVVDDCSDKPYDSIVNDFRNILNVDLIRLSKNGGPGVARQVGIEATTNPYIMFMDADDILINVFTVKEMLSLMNNDKNIYMLSSTFLEEDEYANLIPHENDTVWTFGKLYRRAYINFYGIKFNDTRANEDTGFNTKLIACATNTDYISFVKQATYLWKFRENSITRINDSEYGHNKGFIGYIENKLEALTFPNVNKAYVKDHALGCFGECYKSYNNTKQTRSEFEKVILEYSAKFWQLLVKKLYYEDIKYAKTILTESILNNQYRLLPILTLDDFIKLVEEYNG